MTRIGLIIQSVVAALIFVGLLGWWMYRSLRRSEEPVRLIVKWIITALMAPAIFLAGGAGPYGIIFALVIAAVLVITWGRSIFAGAAPPFGNLFSGGGVSPSPPPFSSPPP